MMQQVWSGDELFPGLYDSEITLGKLSFKWGDLPTESKLVFLCALARGGYTPIVEFGTFRGRTTYNLALNCSADIVTVDIGPEIGKTVDRHQNSADHPYPEYQPGEVFLDAHESIRRRIKQVIGDSTQIDLSSLYDKIGMVLIDGGHSYEVCKSDSELALRLARKGGVLVWDDYGPDWPGVKQAVDELAATYSLYKLEREGIVIHVTGS